MIDKYKFYLIGTQVGDAILVMSKLEKSLACWSCQFSGLYGISDGVINCNFNSIPNRIISSEDDRNKLYRIIKNAINRPSVPSPMCYEFNSVISRGEIDRDYVIDDYYIMSMSLYMSKLILTNL